MVDKIGTGQHIQQTNKAEEKRIGGPSFETMLGKVIGQSGKTEKVAGTESSAPVSPASGLMLNIAPPHIAQAEHTLDLLDRLSAAMTDPAYTPKKAENLFHKLDKEADKLMKSAESLDQTDKAKTILQETAALAKIQVAKFNRGDLI